MMKSQTFILILAIPLFFISCSKKDFSENYFINGHWIEESEIMDREELYFNDNDTLYYLESFGSRYMSTEKFIYSVSKRHTKLYLWPADDPDGQRNTCKIELKNNSTELIISGLTDEFPDLKQKFIKAEY